MKGKRKPLREQYPIAVPCGVLVGLIACAIYIFGTVVPKLPPNEKPRASLSLQEMRR